MLVRFDRELLASGPLAGHVVAVFAHAALARLEPGGALLTLQHPERDLVPFGIVIPWESSLSVGDPVRLEARDLRIGPSRYVLSGDGASLLLPDLPFSREALASHATAALRFLPSEHPALQKLRNPLRRLTEALVGRGSASEISAAIPRLCGAGFGSTPTGDDWLVGVAGLGHRVARTGALSPGAWAAFCAALSAIPAAATTPVSREMLRHASAGRLPEALLRVVALLGAPGTAGADLTDACARLLAVGSQTGGDLLRGALELAQAASPRGYSSDCSKRW